MEFVLSYEKLTTCSKNVLLGLNIYPTEIISLNFLAVNVKLSLNNYFKFALGSKFDLSVDT